MKLNNHIKSTAPRILITNQETLSLRKGYAALTRDYGYEIDFCPLVRTKFIPIHIFRTYKTKIGEYDAIVLTSKMILEAFFRFANECKISFPNNIRYFLGHERLASALQEFVNPHKRRIISGKRQIEDIFPVMHKYKACHFLFPCSQTGNHSIRNFFSKGKFRYAELPLYKHEVGTAVELDQKHYDIIVFFSPVAVNAFHQLYPNYDFQGTQVAAFGERSIQAVKKLKWPLQIIAPLDGIPSMQRALELYCQQQTDSIEMPKVLAF